MYYIKKLVAYKTYSLCKEIYDHFDHHYINDLNDLMFIYKGSTCHKFEPEKCQPMYIPVLRYTEDQCACKLQPKNWIGWSTWIQNKWISTWINLVIRVLIKRGGGGSVGGSSWVTGWSAGRASRVDRRLDPSARLDHSTDRTTRSHQPVHTTGQTAGRAGLSTVHHMSW